MIGNQPCRQTLHSHQALRFPETENVKFVLVEYFGKFTTKEVKNTRVDPQGSNNLVIGVENRQRRQYSEQ